MKKPSPKKASLRDGSLSLKYEQQLLVDKAARAVYSDSPLSRSQTLSTVVGGPESRCTPPHCCFPESQECDV